MTNNRAEAYGLLLGTSIAKNYGLRNLLILGDSAIIIAALTTGKDFRQIALNNIKARIMGNIRSLGNVTFKHVLRINNKEADNHANKASNRQKREVKENDRIYKKDIP